MGVESLWRSQILHIRLVFTCWIQMDVVHSAKLYWMKASYEMETNHFETFIIPEFLSDLLS